jgi:LysM repeat protein
MRLAFYAAGLASAAVISVVGGSSAHAQTTSSKQQVNKQPEKVMVTVNEGDTLISIADAHQSTYARIFDTNTNITNPDLIYTGDTLRIPSADEQLADRPIPADYVAANPLPTYTSSSSYQTPVAPVSYAGNDVWNSLAQCESGGNWAINTGNGFYGGLQFDYGTWLNNGGGAYAPTANLATPQQQIEIATRIQAARGWSPWPACSVKLGL